MFHKKVKTPDQTVDQGAQISQTAQTANENQTGPVLYKNMTQTQNMTTSTPQQKTQERQNPMNAAQANAQAKDNTAQDDQSAAQGNNRAPGAYPGAYPGAAAGGYAASGSNDSASSSSPAQGMSAAAGRRLVIGEGITMSGEIEACENLVVEGTVEASLKGASVLEITETGAFYGTVEIDEAVVAGRFEGDIAVRGRLTVRGTGQITGSIAYKELAVEAGATLDGTISPLDAAGKAQASAPKKTVKVSKARKVSAGQEAANELPFSGKAAAAE